VNIDDPSVLFLAWNEGALRRVDLGEVGASRTIPWSAGPTGLF
jgi:hypothetical protein